MNRFAGRPDTGGRLSSPSAKRNRDAILGVLQDVWTDPSGNILETASGSGEHAVHFARAFQAATIWPSDVDGPSLASIEAWRRHCGLDNLKSPIRLDVTATHWRSGTALPPLADTLDVIMSINMIHIAPWSACEGLLEGAGARLKPDGMLFVYGPFRQRGVVTAESNLEFDRSLRSRNSEWGLRELEVVCECASRFGLKLSKTVAMPANNLSVIFKRQGA